MLFSEDLDVSEEKFVLNTYDFKPLNYRYRESKSDSIIFLRLTEQAIEFHSKPKDMLFVESKLQRFMELAEIKTTQIVKSVDKKIFAIACNGYDDQVLIGMKFEKQEDCQQFYEMLNKGLDLDKKAKFKSEFNYFPIEENLRKIVEHIILKSRPKFDIYKQLMIKFKDKDKKLSPHQSRLILKCLVNNEEEMAEAERKQKIEAYDIDKKDYIIDLKDASQKKNNQKLISIQDYREVQGYTQKREMDGIIKINNDEMSQQCQRDMEKQFQEALCLEQIPHYSALELQQLFKQDKLDVEEPNRQEPNQSHPLGRKMKIDRDKKYKISCDHQIRVQSKVKNPESYNPKVAKAIQAVKVLYQMMKRNNDEIQKQSRSQNKAGPLAEPLQELKDILTQIEKQLDRQKLENRYVAEFIRQASNNYMNYKKMKFKFYQ